MLLHCGLRRSEAAARTMGRVERRVAGGASWMYRTIPPRLSGTAILRGGTVACALAPDEAVALESASSPVSVEY